MIDTHTHSIFSADGSTSCRDLILAAIEKGLKYIAITDHCDRDYLYAKPGTKKVVQLDFDKQFATLYELKCEFANKIHIGIGLEVGYSQRALEDNIAICKKYPYDTIINSVHTINGEDAYYKEYFHNKSLEVAYGDYLKAVRESIDVPYEYNSIAHIGYPTRYAPYPDTYMYYDQFKEQIDDILLAIINKGKALEVNTNVVSPQTLCLPYIEIIKRYKDLGGEFVTFASDTHTTKRICDGYEFVTDYLFSLGFKSICYYEQMTMKQYKI